MLYLLEPSGHTRWSNMPAKAVLDAVRDHGADLTLLDWDPAERIAGPTDVRVALRSGVPVPTGIVVDAGLLVEQDQPAIIREASRRPRPEFSQGHRDGMERLIPGWTQHGAQLDAKVDAAMERAATEADREAVEALGGPPNPALVEHWRSIGGLVPTPA